MKYIKIFLAILAVAAVCLVIYFGYSKTTKIGTVDLPENPFTRRISQEIEAISSKPVSRFCKDAYKITKYHIDDYASLNRLGADSLDISGNSQNQKFLYKTLYSTYVDKFISQADYVFKGNAWTNDDLSFIKSEINSLRTEGRKNKFLESGGVVDKTFIRMSNTIDSYYNEIKYINECKNFSFGEIDIEKRFPVDRAKNIIDGSKEHLSSLGVIKNSDAVRKGLESIPERVLTVHVSYLNDKFNEYKQMYIAFNTLGAYKTNLYDVFKSEISQLDNSMYSGLNVAAKKTRLMNNLDNDYQGAIQYYQHK